jgi:hypothetical protein
MRRAVILAIVLAPLAASAEEMPVLHRVQAPAHNPLDCYCRAQGKMFAVGESICLRTSQGPRVAECQMVTNVTSWGISERPCPEA